MPNISVIVPVYNVERYLPRCIDSILEQTFTDFELILVDDGSTDKSGGICDIYAKKDARIRIIHKENGGVSSARNVGISAACGNFIAFCDSDDFVSREYLASLFSGDGDLTICGMYLCDGDGSNVTVNRKEKDGTFAVTDINIMRWFENRSLYSACTCLFKTAIIKNNRLLFDTKTSRGEDTIFIFEYLSFCKTVSFISSVLYYYARYSSGGTLTTSSGLKNIYSLGYLDDYLNQWFSKRDLYSAYFNDPYFWTRNELKQQFYLVLDDNNMPLRTKKAYYKAFKRQKAFYDNRKTLFFNKSKKFKFMLNTFYPNLILLYDLKNIKRRDAK